MRSKELAGRTILEMPGKWAMRCQISGQSPVSHAQVARQNSVLNCGLRTMRRLGTLVCVLAMPFVTFAETNQSSWENLSALGAGHKIQVVEMNSKTVFGTFLSVNDAGMSLQAAGGAQTIQRQDVRVVKLMENKHRLRNAAIGAAVGAGVGAGVGAAVGKGNGAFDFAGQGAAIVAAAGGVIGAIVGALWPSHKIIYRVRTP